MRVCIESATGKLIEMQSAATAGTLIANAVAMGYAQGAIEEREVDDTEFASILAAQSPESTEPKTSFFARDLIALLSPVDYAAIQSAIASSPQLGLLWTALLAQGSAPIQFTSERFQAGWTALGNVLGTQRTAALAESLGVA